MIYTVPEAAKLLRESPQSVYKSLRLGKFPGAYKVGTQGRTSRWMIPDTAITKYQAAAA